MGPLLCYPSSMPVRQALSFYTEGTRVPYCMRLHKKNVGSKNRLPITLSNLHNPDCRQPKCLHGSHSIIHPQIKIAMTLAERHPSPLRGEGPGVRG